MTKKQPLQVHYQYVKTREGEERLNRVYDFIFTKIIGTLKHYGKQHKAKENRKTGTANPQEGER